MGTSTWESASQHEESANAGAFVARMPDVSNLGGHGHGLIGPVKVELGPDSLSLTGHHFPPRPWPIASAMLSGALAGLLLGAWVAPPFGPSLVSNLMRALAICVPPVLGGVLGAAIFKAYAMRVSEAARLTFPLESLRLLESSWRPHPIPGPTGPPAGRLASWLILRYRSRRELLLLAPDESGSFEPLRLVFDAPDDAATVAARVRDWQRGRGSGC